MSANWPSSNQWTYSGSLGFGTIENRINRNRYMSGSDDSSTSSASTNSRDQPLFPPSKRNPKVAPPPPPKPTTVLSSFVTEIPQHIIELNEVPGTNKPEVAGPSKPISLQPPSSPKLEVISVSSAPSSSSILRQQELKSVVKITPIVAQPPPPLLMTPKVTSGYAKCPPKIELQTQKKLETPATPAALPVDCSFQGTFEYGVRREGSKFYGHPLPTSFSTLSFEGKLLGFDERSYAYIRVLSNEKMTLKYELLKKQLTKIYLDPSADQYTLKVEDLQLKEIVVVRLKTCLFIRARVLAVRVKDNLILVLDVDEGSFHEVADAQIYPIDDMFLQLPFMCIRCKLYELDYLLGTDSIGTVLNKLYGAPRMKMTVIRNETIPTILMVSLDCQESLNQIVARAISRFNPFPGVFEMGMVIQKGRIIDTDGKQYIWYQIPSPVSDFLIKLQPIKEVPDNLKKTNLQLISENVTTFAAPSIIDPKCYSRVVIYPGPNLPEQVRGEYKDYGMNSMFNVKDLVPIDYFDPIINEIPAQCVKFRTHPGDYIPRKDLEKMKLQKMNHNLTITEISKEGGPPRVEFCVFFSDQDETKWKPSKVEGGRSSSSEEEEEEAGPSEEESKRLIFSKGDDFPIHKYDPISQNPMSQISVGRLPTPFHQD